ENFERRDKLRWSHSIVLRFDTSADQLRFILVKIKEILVGHPLVINEPGRVRFVRFGTNGFEIDMFAYIRSTDWNEYLAVVEDLNLRIVQLINDAGAAFAYPGAPVNPDKEPGVKQLAAEETMKKLQESGGYPLPLYPQEWIEPRTDVLAFGALKKDTETGS